MVRAHGRRSGLSAVDRFEAETVDTDELSVTNVGGLGHLTTNQTIPSGTVTKVQIEDTVFDDGGEFDTTNDNFVPADDGVYYIVGNVEYVELPDGTVYESRIYINGSIKSNSYMTAGAANRVTAKASLLTRLTSGDTVEFFTLQDSGAGQDLAYGSYRTRQMIMGWG
jgi:hypothetical protein